jgi:hypothetical protein
MKQGISGLVQTNDLIRAKTISLLLHNSIIFLSVYWAPRYLAMPFRLSDLQAHGHLQLFLRDANTVALMGDCVEFISLGSLNLLLQLYLYSSKLKHIHSLKLFVFVTAKGLIAFRSSISGGGTREPQGHEQVTNSPVFKKFMDDHPDAQVIAFLDRGFTRTHVQSDRRVHLLYPTSGEKDLDTLSSGHAAWRQVPPKRVNRCCC